MSLSQWVSSLNDNDLEKRFALTPKKGASDASSVAHYPVYRLKLHRVCRLHLFFLHCVYDAHLGYQIRKPHCMMHVFAKLQVWQHAKLWADNETQRRKIMSVQQMARTHIQIQKTFFVCVCERVITECGGNNYQHKRLV